MDRFDTLVFPIEWKASGDDVNVLEGYASTFGNVDLQGDVIKAGAFRKTIKERIKSGKVKLLDSHVPDTAHVLGTVVEAKEDKRGLWIKAKLSTAPSVQDLRVKMLEGHIDRMSIGYSPVKHRYEKRDVDGRQFTVRVLEEIKLHEVSVVAFPANERAAIASVKHAINAAAEALETIDADEHAGLGSAIKNLHDAVLELDTKAAPHLSAPDLDDELDEDDEGGTKTSASTDSDTDPATDLGGGGETDDAPDQKDAPGEQDPSDEDGEPAGKDQSLEDLLRRGRALLEGRDPDEVAEPSLIAALDAKFEVWDEHFSDLLSSVNTDGESDNTEGALQ